MLRAERKKLYGADVELAAVRERGGGGGEKGGRGGGGGGGGGGGEKGGGGGEGRGGGGGGGGGEGGGADFTVTECAVPPSPGAGVGLLPVQLPQRCSRPGGAARDLYGQKEKKKKEKKKKKKEKEKRKKKKRKRKKEKKRRRKKEKKKKKKTLDDVLRPSGSGGWQRTNVVWTGQVLRRDAGRRP